METATYRKDYLPGYTGFVPMKNHVFSCTAGEINRILTGRGTKPSNHEIDGEAGRPFAS